MFCLWFGAVCSCRHVNHNSLDYINSLADLQVYLLFYCCACPRYVVQPQHAGCSVTDLTLGESCDPTLESPCSCAGLTFTCPKQVDLFDSCHDRFHEYFVANSECLEAESESLYELEFLPVRSKLLYVPIIVITSLMLIWCAYNQKVKPVERSCDILESHEGEADEGWTQTGYKKNPLGLALYVLVLLLHLEFQAMLLFFSIEYCEYQLMVCTICQLPHYSSMYHIFVQSDIQAVNEVEGGRNEASILVGFILTWMVGFFWCFCLKYPQSIYSLFLRRCLPIDATHIAVTAPAERVDTLYEQKYLANFFGVVQKTVCRLMNFIYSIEPTVDQYGVEYKTTYCTVVSGESIDLMAGFDQ